MVVGFHCGRGLKDDFSIMRLVRTLWIVNASATQTLNYEIKESRGQDIVQYRQQRSGQRPWWTAEVRLYSVGQDGQQRSGCTTEVRMDSRGQAAQRRSGWTAEVRLHNGGQDGHQRSSWTAKVKLNISCQAWQRRSGWTAEGRMDSRSQVEPAEVNVNIRCQA
jgi:hypothetical protein